MKKVELSVSKQNNVETIKYVLNAADVYDDRVIEKVTGLNNIIAVQYTEENGKKMLTSYAHEDTNLASMIKKPLNKKQVLCIMSGLASLFEIGAQGIPVSYIYKDENYIYINQNTLAVKGMIIPVKQDIMPLAEIPEFFRSVISQMMFEEEGKDDYVARVITAINTPDFAIAKFKSIVNDELEKMGLFISKDNGLTNMMDGNGAPAPTNNVRVSKVGVMNNMQNSMYGQPPMGMPPMGQPGPNGQPPMGRPMGQPGPNGQPPMGMPPMGQPGPNGQPPMGRPMGQPGPNGQPPMGMPPMGQPGPNGQPPMGRPMGQPPVGVPPMGQPGPNGQPPVGMPPMGQPGPNGQPPVGMPPMGQPGPNSQSTIGKTVGQLGPNGQTPVEQSKTDDKPETKNVTVGMPPMSQPVSQPTKDEDTESDKNINKNAENADIPKMDVAPETSTPAKDAQPVAPQQPAMNNVQPAPQPVAPQQPAMNNVQPAPQPVAPQQPAMNNVQPAPQPVAPQQPAMNNVQPAPQPVAPQQPAMNNVQPAPQPVAPQQPTMNNMQPAPQPGMPPMGMQSAMPGDGMMHGNLVGQMGSKPVPHIVRKKTGEAIYITKPEFSIGKSKTKADYALEDNTAISRVHCIIVQKDGVNYIKDNGSTNHTFVNGVELEPGKEILLKNKTVIQMGDEEFTFLLRKGE